VAMTSSGVAVAANGARLIVQQSASSQPVNQSLPDGITSFDDVSIDAGNETLVFALSTFSQRVCSFLLFDGDLTLVNCVGEGDNFGVGPFTGVSALDSTLIISGGTTGITIYQYDTISGVISDTPSVLNRDLGVIGHPDVVLVSANVAALSTDFSVGTPRFGTQMASIEGSEVTFDRDFRVQNSLAFQLFVTPANFPLVNAIYETSTNTYMYTANGPMQVQEPLSSDTIDLLTGAPNGFSAVTVAVNTAKKIALFGVVSASGESQILFYDLSVDPRDPILIESIPIVGQRIVSIASGGDVAAYTTLSLDNIQFVPLSQTDLCVQDGTDEFLFRLNPNNGNPVVMNCNELTTRNNASRICKRRVDYSGIYSPPQDICLETCNSCLDCYQNGRSRFFLRLRNDGTVRLHTCNWLMKRSTKQKRRICNRTASNGGYGPARRHCPVICGVGSC